MADAYAIARRAATAANGGVSPNGAHGLASTYNNYFCRCESCTSAKREQNAEQRDIVANTDSFLPLRAERMTWIDTPWMTDALCREIGDGPFFPEKGESARPGKAICRQCSARVPCLDFALTADTPLHGIWGGLTERERRRLGRRSA